MKYQVAALLFSIVGSQPVWAGDAATNSNAASAEVAPSLAEMGAAANAHDVERHVGFYAHDASVVFIFNGEPRFLAGSDFERLLTGEVSGHAARRLRRDSASTDIRSHPRAR